MHEHIGLEETQVHCPYCGETFVTCIDTSIEQQNYIEDCQICCSPIVFNVLIATDGYAASVELQRDNE